MAIQRTTPATISLGTSGSTSGLYGLVSHATNGSQSNVVSSGTSNNITGITCNLDISLPSVTTATASTKVDIYVWGSNDDAGYPGNSTGTEVITGSAGLITLSGVANNSLKFAGVATCPANTTAAVVRLDFPVHVSLGFIPRRWGLVFINNTGVTLPNTGHVAEYVEEFYT